MWDLWTLPSLHVSLWRGSCQPVLGFLVVGGERGWSQVPISRWPLARYSSMCCWSLGKWQTDLITHNKTRVCKAIWSLVEFLWEGTACVCECVEEGLGGPGWLLKWGVLKGVLFLHISCLQFFYTVHYCFCKDKAVGYLYSWNTLLYFFTVIARRKCVQTPEFGFGWWDSTPQLFGFFFRFVPFIFFYCGK